MVRLFAGAPASPGAHAVGITVRRVSVAKTRYAPVNRYSVCQAPAGSVWAVEKNSAMLSGSNAVPLNRLGDHMRIASTPSPADASLERNAGLAGRVAGGAAPSPRSSRDTGCCFSARQ